MNRFSSVQSESEEERREVERETYIHRWLGRTPENS